MNLRPCRGCGGPAKYCPPRDDDYHYVICKGGTHPRTACPVESSWAKTEAEVVAEWNRRMTPPHAAIGLPVQFFMRASKPDDRVVRPATIFAVQDAAAGVVDLCVVYGENLTRIEHGVRHGVDEPHQQCWRNIPEPPPFSEEGLA